MLLINRNPIGSTKRSAAAGGLSCALLLAALALVRPAQAQVLCGTLTGTVTDPQGAAAVAVNVKVVNAGTNIGKSATTDARGFYLFSDLQPGTYDVTIEAPGFKTSVGKGIRIEATTVRRIDAQLEVSGISETVEVTSAAPVLQTDRADVHVTQTARQVNELPLTGSVSRNYQSLIVSRSSPAANGAGASQGAGPVVPALPRVGSGPYAVTSMVLFTGRPRSCE